MPNRSGIGILERFFAINQGDQAVPILQVAPEYELYYELVPGLKERPCLVFLHEGLGCTDLWKDFPKRLCDLTGCPGLVYDRRGYGRSSPLAGPRTIHYLHEYALLELPRVLAAVIPDRDYLVIGHSDGGSIALIHAAERPAGLRGIITEAAHVFVEQETVDGIRAADDAYLAGKLHRLARYHGDKTDTTFKAWSRTWITEGFRHWNIEYLLPSIQVPALVMQGVQDQYATAAQVTAIVGRVGNREAVMIPHCGHTPHQEQPELTLQRMATFIRDPAARTPG